MVQDQERKKPQDDFYQIFLFVLVCIYLYILNNHLTTSGYQSCSTTSGNLVVMRFLLVVGISDWEMQVI